MKKTRLFLNLPSTSMVHFFVSRSTMNFSMYTSIPSVLRMLVMFSPKNRLQRVVFPAPLCPTNMTRIVLSNVLPSVSACRYNFSGSVPWREGFFQSPAKSAPTHSCYFIYIITSISNLLD